MEIAFASLRKDGSVSAGAKIPREPPPGPPWDLPVEQAPFVFLDFEMTGLSLERDRVIEVSALRVEGGSETGLFTSLVRPACGTFGNEHVHKISRKDLENAPIFADVGAPLLAIFEGAVLVAHGADWDVKFLAKELQRASMPAMALFYIDTLTLARRAFPGRSHALATLAEELELPQRPAHRAEADVRALAALWPHLISTLRPTTPRDLWHVRVGERRARPEIIAAAQLAMESATPVRVRHRPSRRPVEEKTIMVTGVRSDLDPPRVLGYSVASRGRLELRADRILAIEPTEPR